MGAVADLMELRGEKPIWPPLVTDSTTGDGLIKATPLAGIAWCSQCGFVVVCLKCGNYCCTGHSNACCDQAYKVQTELYTQFANAFEIEADAKPHHEVMERLGISNQADQPTLEAMGVR